MSARGIAVTILLLCTLVALAGCGEETGRGGEGDDGQQSSRAQDPEPTQQPQEGSSPEEQQSEGASQEQQQSQEQTEVASIGEEVTVGDVSYTVTDAERVSQLDDPYGLDEPLTGNFMLVSFTFTNNGSDPATVSDVGMYLYDEEGNQYETDSDAGFYLPEDTSMFLLDRVNPGLSQEVQTVYEIPPDAEGFELEVTSGLLASETARIDLETGSDTQSSGSEAPADVEAAEEAAGDYYRAAGMADWDYTYANLDSETQALFAEEEWTLKNQWFEDSNPVIYHILSVEMIDTAEEPLAEVTLRLTPEEGSGFTRTTYFVLEDGSWKHRFSQEETDLFMPEASFEEFVQAYGG